MPLLVLLLSHAAMLLSIQKELLTFRKVNSKVLLNIASLLTNRCVQVHECQLCYCFNSRG